MIIRQLVIPCTVLFALAACTYAEPVTTSPDPCEANPCQNEGTCEATSEGNASCSCPDGFEGELCELPKASGDPCDPNPCQNEGTCTAATDGGATCACPDGYEGELCETETVVDPCDPNPCQNGGSCSAEGDGSTSCACAEGFEGDLCETETELSACEFHCEGIVAAQCDKPDVPNVGACVTVCEQLRADPSCGSLFDTVVGCMGESNAWTCMPSDPNAPDGETSFVPAEEACVQPFGTWYQCTQMADPCNAFCDAAATTCTGDDAMDFGDAGCFDTCIAWAPGTKGDTEGDTLACRAYHLAVAAEDSPEVHCMHAGPDGGGVCDAPTWCEIACAESAECADELDAATCTAECEEALSGDCSDAYVALKDCAESSGEWECGADGIAIPAGGACSTEIEGIDACIASLDPCFDAPCMNGGECVSNEDDTFTCQCLDGYIGDTCEMLDPCFPSPCVNGGTCEIADDNTALCTCPDGYLGDTCEEMDYCTATCAVQSQACEGSAEECVEACYAHEQGPCGAEVLALQECQPPEAWICDDEGLAVPQGDACALEWQAVLECLDPCLPDPCAEAEACVAMDDGTASCVATTCDEEPCQNGGSCYEWGEEGDPVTCFCEDGFYGPMCEYVVTPCEPENPCENGGLCSVTEDGEGFSCECSDGYTGETCSYMTGGPCDPSPCGNGTCGEIEALCQGNDGCEDDTCKDAVCALDDWCCDNWDSACAACAAGEETFYADCTNIEGCDLAEPLAVCSCDEGWQGEFCDVDVDECADNFMPCLNEATCVNTDGGYACECLEGWEGDNCETNIDDCPEENPCQNEGTCIDGVNAFTCDCVEGTEGDLCEENINECLEEGLCGAGECVDELPGYSCVCPPEFAGEHCEFDNPCVEGPCQNGGLCVEEPLPGGFSCDTSQGGPGCAENAECEAAVCAVDSFCCNNSWDSLCGKCADGSGGINTEGCQVASLSCALPGGYTFTCECSDGYQGDTCESCGQCGDVDGNGNVTQEDVDAMAANGGGELSECLAWVSDVNGDGAVNVVDIQVLTDYVNGDLEELSCPMP